MLILCVLLANTTTCTRFYRRYSSDDKTFIRRCNRSIINLNRSRFSSWVGLWVGSGVLLHVLFSLFCAQNSWSWYYILYLVHGGHGYLSYIYTKSRNIALNQKLNENFSPATVSFNSILFGIDQTVILEMEWTGTLIFIYFVNWKKF